MVCKHKIPVPGSQMLKWCGKAAQDTAVGPRCAQHSPPAGTAKNGQRTRAIMCAQKLLLDQQDRHDLAKQLVGHSGSWSTLSEDDARQLAMAIDAFLVIQTLLLMKRRRQ